MLDAVRIVLIFNGMGVLFRSFGIAPMLMRWIGQGPCHLTEKSY